MVRMRIAAVIAIFAWTSPLPAVAQSQSPAGPAAPARTSSTGAFPRLGATPIDVGANAVAFGLGFDSILNVARESCVEPAETEPPERLLKAGGDVRNGGYVATSAEEVARKSSLSVGASLGYGPASASAEYQAIREGKVSRTTVYALITAYSRTDPFVTGGRLRDDVKDLDAVSFRNRCGDIWISGAAYGARYSGRLRVDTRSEEQLDRVKQSVDAAVNQGLFTGRANADTTNEFRRLLNEATTSFEVDYTGNPVGEPHASCGPDAVKEVPTADVSQMIKFGSTISCRGRGEFKVLTWYASPYPSRGSSPLTDDSVLVADLMKIYDRRNSLIHALASLKERRLQSPGVPEYMPIDRDLAEREMAALNNLLDDFRDRSDELASGDPKRKRKFRTDLSASVQGVKVPLRRAKLHQPDARVRGPVVFATATKGRAENPVWMTLWGQYSVGNRIPDFNCPGNPRICFANVYLRTPDGKSSAAIPLNQDTKPFRVPGANRVLFEMNDNILNDNSWLDNSGLLEYEDLDPEDPLPSMVTSTAQ